MAEGWKVVAQQQKQVLGINGRIEDVWELTYKTDGNVVGTVRVPVADYQPDKVRALIDAQVELHQAIAEL